MATTRRSTREQRIRNDMFAWLAMTAEERAASAKNKIWDGNFAEPREARKAVIARSLKLHYGS